MLDSLSQTIGTPVEFNGYPLGTRATQLSGVRAFRLRDKQPSLGDKFLKLFGKPLRLQSCECERTEETTLPQTFQMVSGPSLNQLLTHPKNRLTQIITIDGEPCRRPVLDRPDPPAIPSRSRSLQKSPCQRERSSKGVGRYRLGAGQFVGLSAAKIIAQTSRLFSLRSLR